MPPKLSRWRATTLLLLCALLPHLISATPIVVKNAADITTPTPTLLLRQAGEGSNVTQTTPSSTTFTPTPTPTSTGTSSANGPPFHWYYFIPLFIGSFAFIYVLTWLGLCGRTRQPEGSYVLWQQVWSTRAYGRLITWRRKPPQFGLQRMFPQLCSWTITLVPWDGDPNHIAPGCWIAGPTGTKQQMKAFWQVYRPRSFSGGDSGGGGGG